MRKKAGSFGFAAATTVFLLIAAVSFAGTAVWRMDLKGAELEDSYRERERRMLENAEAFLNGQGYVNSGVTLTRVVEGDGSRRYTLTVHHRKIDQMEVSEREALARELAAFAFADDNSTFSYEFLLSD